MRKQSSLHNRKSQSRASVILWILVVAVLCFMTTGFAAYNRILNINGSVTLQPQGKIRITSVTYTGGSHSTANPTFTDTEVDFGLSFTSGDPETDTFNATFSITIQNDTFYNQVFSVPEYNAVIRDGNGNPVTDAELEYELNGINNGDVIPTEQGVTFTVVITLLPTTSGNYTIDGEMEIDFEDEQTGQMFARVSSSTTGDLRSPNTRAAFTVTVINTFDYQREFTLILANNGNFYLGTAAGAHNYSGTIAANTTQDYTVYVYPTDPNASYSSDYERANIYLQSTGISDINAGRITLLVDKTVVSTDTDAPVVSNLVATQQTTEGEATLTWNATDESTIDHFTIRVYRLQNNGNNGTLVQTINTTDDDTSYTVTGLGDNRYYFVVYGTDVHGNTATNSEISGATTNSGHATRSANVSFDWNFTITYDLGNNNNNRVNSSNTATTIKYGNTYTTTLSYNTNQHPSSSNVTVTMGGNTLPTSSYSYSANTGVLTIPNVTGNLNIHAQRNSGTCLIEGTKVTLWNGATKAIEDVNYDDLLKVWSYDLGRFVPAYPIWIENAHSDSTYRRSTFSDGTTLGTVGYHSVFSVDKGEFVSVDSADYYEGVRILKDVNGKLTPVTVEKIEMINQPVNYYNVVSTYYYNIVANDILTADGMSIISNLYGFTDDYRWPASRAQMMAQPGALYDYSLFADIMPYSSFKGLRIEEAGIVRNYFPADYLKSFLGEFLLSDYMMRPQTMRPAYAANGRYWMFTTSEDNLANKAKYLVKEGSEKVVPAGTWFNSSDGQTYHGGDRIQVWTSIHLTKLSD